jgi:hypothetical protein
MMFVKIFAVLYELHLNYLLKRSDVIHRRYKRAFLSYYKLHDEYVAICAEYSHMPACIVGEKEQAYIDAAGGRQSNANKEKNKREIAATKIDGLTSRARLRVKNTAETRVATRRSTTVSISRAATAALQ